MLRFILLFPLFVPFSPRMIKLSKEALAALSQSKAADARDEAGLLLGIVGEFSTRLLQIDREDYIVNKCIAVTICSIHQGGRSEYPLHYCN